MSAPVGFRGHYLNVHGIPSSAIHPVNLQARELAGFRRAGEISQQVDDATLHRDPLHEVLFSSARTAVRLS
jgi:hypothetical protein